MNDKLLLIAIVLAVAVTGCGQKDDSESASEVVGTEQASEPSSGVVETVKGAASESAAVIEANVESIEANIEKRQDQSTVSSEQYQESEKLPMESLAEPTPAPAEVVEEQVEVVEENPADK